MKHRRKLFPLMAFTLCFGLVATNAFGVDPLQRGQRGGGSGGGSLGGQKQDPPRRESPPPRREDPPKRESPPPRREDPPRRETPPPRREDPPRRETPRRDDPLNRGGGSRGGGSLGGGSNSGGSNNGGSNSGGSVGGGSNRGGPTGGLPPQRGDDPRGNPRGGNASRGNPQGDVYNPRPQPGRDDSLLGKKSGSRSGSVQYGSNTNYRKGGQRRDPIIVGRVPLDINRGSLAHQVRRSDEIRIGGLRIRVGYDHYDSRWRDDYFYYPHYVFDPYQRDFACSPWYYYPQLPAYFDTRRCYFPAAFRWAPFYGVRYQWNQPSRSYWNRDYNELDYVAEDLTSAFMNGDRQAVGRLIPRNGQVGIIMDGQFAYNLRSDDFYDTLLDATENTRTLDYKILDIQYRRDAASVFARHDFEDPWGRRTSVFHYFKLETEGRNWVIREFGTSNNRW